MKKRVLSIVLACLMILSVVPFTAFAAEAKCTGIHPNTNVVEGGSYVWIKDVPSTCGEWGYSVFYCEDCENYFAANFDYTDANGHDYQVTTPGKSATCTEDGVTAVMTCTKCGHVTGGTKISAGHTWVPKSENANCLEGGKTWEECSVCGEKRNEQTLAPNGHEWKKIPTTMNAPYWENGVLQNGSAIYNCENCEETKTVVVLADHVCKYQWVDEVPADCVNAGVAGHYICSVDGCNKLYIDGANGKVIVTATDLVIPAKAHKDANGQSTYVEIDRQDAVQCAPGVAAQAGWIKYECTECGDTYVDDIPAPSHSYDATTPTATKAPTCTTFGFNFYACTICGEIAETVRLDKIPCGLLLYDENGVKTTNQDISDNADILGSKEPTCEGTGFVTYTCKVCVGTPKVQNLAATGHNPVEGKVEGTCAKKGYTFKYCTNTAGCSYALQSSVNGYDVTVNGAPVQYVTGSLVVGDYDAQNHEWFEQRVMDATCTSPATWVKYCKNCSNVPHEYYVKGDPLGHNKLGNNGVAVSSTPADCINNATITWNCSMCHEDWIEIQKNTATGHSMTSKTTYPVSCTNNEAYEIVSCANSCGKTQKNMLGGETYDEHAEKVMGVDGGWTLSDAQALHAGLSADPVNGKDNMTGAEIPDNGIFRQGDCNIVGLYRYYCSDCEEYILVKIDGTGLGHKDDGVYDKIGEFPAQAADCHYDGWTAQYYCEECGTLVESVAIKAFNHVNPANGKSWIVVDKGFAANCTNPGLTDGAHCTECNTITIPQNEIKAKGHKWTPMSDGATAAYCSKTWEQCTVCGAKQKENEVAHDIQLVDGRKATCGLYGYDHYDCVNCELEGEITVEWIENYEEAFDADHTPGTEDRLEATCTVDGYSRYYCTICGELLTEVILEAPGHYNVVDGEIVPINTDCTAKIEGEDRVCDDCGLLVPYAHKYQTKELYEANCIQVGHEIQICTLCEEEQVVVLNNGKLGDHKWSKWTVVEEATWAAPGTKMRTCAICPKVETDSVPQLTGAKFNYVVETKNITDASEVKVVINLATDALYSFKLDLTYSKSKLALVDAKFVAGDTFKGANVVNTTPGVVTVVASASNGSAAANVAYEGAILELTFKVNTSKAETLEIAMAATALDEKSNVLVPETKNVEIKVAQFLNVDGKNGVDLADAYALNQIIVNGGYSVVADLNKNGDVSLAELVALYQYIAGELTYEEMLNYVEE